MAKVAPRMRFAGARLSFGRDDMYVYLTYEQELFIKSMLETGRYENAAAVIHDALRALKDEDDRPEQNAAAIVPFDRDRDVEFFRTL
jgi:putative addiction module CopG family antidote